MFYFGDDVVVDKDLGEKCKDVRCYSFLGIVCMFVVSVLCIVYCVYCVSFVRPPPPPFSRRLSHLAVRVLRVILPSTLFLI